MKFLKKAENNMAFAKVGIYGEAGSGKTRTAAEIAIGLIKSTSNKKPVGMFDTEPASAFIAPLFKEAGIEFLVYDESRALVDLMGFMDEAEKECSVVIIDSVTHVWKDVQESYLAKLNEGRARNHQKPIYQLEFHHWRPIKAEWGKFTDRYLSSRVHCIVCGRAGSIYEYQDGANGKKELITTGTKMATEKEMGYEPSLLIEMVKHRDGGRIVNRAVIEKDRADKLNGHFIDFPNYKKLCPHFDFLNIGGEHFSSMSQRNSSDLFDEEGNDGWNREKRNREIWCEEIQGLLTKYYPSQSADDKKAKGDLIEKHLETRSWTKVENMASEAIKAAYHSMKDELEKA